jgi:ADP-L-glycero-D-manno-heptose 6-epimerase
MKRILLTGSLGHIGSVLTLKLQKLYPDAEIIAYDNLISGDFRNLQGFKGQFIHSTNNGQLGSFWNKEFDAIFHLGSLTDTTNSNLKDHLENNINGAKFLFYLKSKVLVYASSASVYGIGTTNPNKETDDLKPANAYAFSKVQLERLMKEHSPNSMGFRFFNVYGPNESHKGHSASMVYQILKKVKNGENVELFKSGEQRRDFIYVDDVCNLLIKAAQNPKPGIYNCGSGYSASFNEVFGQAKIIYPKSKSVIYWKDNPYSFFQEYTSSDMEKTIESFNWCPEYMVNDGMFELGKSI